MYPKTRNGEEVKICLLLYVDDILIAGKSKVEVAEVKRLLNSELKMKDRSRNEYWRPGVRSSGA